MAFTANFTANKKKQQKSSTDYYLYSR